MSDSTAEDTVELPVLRAPAEGVPPVVDTPEALSATIASLQAGHGPIAVDTERAHGFRYSSRAYLIQLRRAGAGTHLVDPVAFRTAPEEADLSALGAAIADDEWIIHAATQDTPCLAEVGMLPQTLFDTELAARLLGLPKVGLGALIERYFSVRLLKEHSAADWSLRPLPDSWLAYASLDVELLIELRAKILADLEAAGKQEWARQEFAHLAAIAGRPAPVREDPWRRTSGMNVVRTARGLAVVRELWQTRDEIARRLDRSPSKILPDRAISELAAIKRPTREAMRGIEGFRRRAAKRYEANWLNALDAAMALPDTGLPPLRLASKALPAPRNWERQHPEAYARFLAAREAIGTLAERWQLPPENLLSPEPWRRLAWQPPARITAETVDAALAKYEARRWQRELTVPALVEALQD